MRGMVPENIDAHGRRAIPPIRVRAGRAPRTGRAVLLPAGKLVHLWEVNPPSTMPRRAECGPAGLNYFFANLDSARRKFHILVLLTLVAGFVDTAGFILLFELFTAHITGNTVIAIADIVHRGGAGALAAFLMLPIFACTVIVFTLFIDAARGLMRERILAIMIALEAVLIVAFFVAALELDPTHSTPDGLPVIIVGGLGVIAMAAQNTIAGALPKPSTVMTGNATNIIIYVVRWLRALRRRDSALRERSRAQLQILWPTLLAFGIGGALAAVGVVTIGYWSLLIPVPVTVVAAIYAIGVPPAGGIFDVAPTPQDK
ncbi:MAG TPA: YoaK family protein [Rhodanobacteraceae bacterium]|nr:YoaK family protein [Rhodanobacteraceae bacterium]